MIKQLGYRGYLSSRPVADGRVPQHAQDLVIRDYCAGNNMHLLSRVTEYATPNCYIMLEQVLKDSAKNQGLVLYSLFQLPQGTSMRKRIFNIVLENKIELHMALESLVIKDKDSAQRVEDIWLVHQTLYGHKSDAPGKSPAAIGINTAAYTGFAS